MSEWARGLVAAAGVLAGIILLISGQFVGPELAAVLQLAAPLVFVAGFALSMLAERSDRSSDRMISPWLLFAAALPLAGFSSCVPFVIAALWLLLRAVSQPGSVLAWVGFATVSMVVTGIMGSSLVVSLTGVVVAGCESVLALLRPREPAV